MIVVLEGTVTAVLQEETHTLQPGDFIGVSPGPENTHYVRNDGNDPARILVIASARSHDEVRTDENP